MQKEMCLTEQQGSYSNLRIKIRDFFRTRDTEKSAPIFVLFRASTYEYDSETRHCEITYDAILLCA